MILITGADGLIGGALFRLRVGRGVPCSGTSISGTAGLLPFELSHADHFDVPKGVETAVLCAWYGGVNECAAARAETHALNVDGNTALIGKLRRSGVNIIFLSTSLVFSGTEVGPFSTRMPCCEYARQKVAVEEALDPGRDAVVRVTKVGETLLPRLRGWAGNLARGEPIRVASDLRVACVMLHEVVGGLAWLAQNFQPGVFQMSAAKDAGYRDIACALAGRLQVSSNLLIDTPLEGGIFQAVPATGVLEIAGPVGCTEWPDGRDVLQTLVEQAISC